ncbi:breast carcinoma-amplified sequence 4 isoform X1 [Eublepharis macularius]|uniref:Breast carcinoma-amplified sequence 4 isoform X1 n=1 Tax=Eublepharis macularius TaxID=481883 RepID=A0AA97JGL2_EUBMA|nr:breast carcinoma-amplified sequence 4 isoform X1 [Eublepharis macularius]
MSAAAASSEGEQPSVALRLASQPSGGDRAAQEEGSRGENARSVEAAVEEPAAAAEGNEARHFALCLAPEAGAEVQEVEESIEEMLIRLDEFCGMTDMIRSDTSQLLDEAIPLIKAKMIEMNNIYMKVDKLETEMTILQALVQQMRWHETFMNILTAVKFLKTASVKGFKAFVKMVGQHLSFLEEQVLQAEKAHAVLPYTVRKLFGSSALPLFNNKHTSSPQHTYNLPELYRTEDYFPIKYIGSKYQSH